MKLPRNRDCFFALLLTAVTFLAYLPAWSGKPIWDDDAHITRPDLRSLSGLLRIWIEPGAAQQYYPLVHSVFWFEHRLWGDSPLGYHLVNILFHCVSALLLLRILRKLRVPGAPLASAIFALHPIQVESVAWITELKNTLSAACYLGAALLYLEFDQDRSRRRYAAALGLFLLALLCKSVTATLPAALLVIFWWKRGNLRWKQDVLPLVPFLAAGFLAGRMTVWVEHNYVIGPQTYQFHLVPLERVLIAGRAFWFYVGKLCWPWRLAFIYPRWHVSASVAWQYLFPAAALALLVLLCVIARRNRGPLAAILFFGGTLFPALGFFDVYPFRYSFVADHFQYLASLGVICLFAAAAVSGLQRLGTSALSFYASRILISALLVVLACLTWRQCGMYKDIQTLWRATLAQNPDCALAHNNLGWILLQNGNLDEALPHLERAVEIQDDFTEAHNNLGLALMQKRQFKQAIAQFRAALAIQPSYAGAHNNLATALGIEGQTQAAIAEYQQALRYNPGFAEARVNLGNALLESGKLEEGLAEFRKALEIQPNLAEGHFNLGNALFKLGRTPEAIEEFRKMIALQPDSAAGHYSLGMALYQQQRSDEAAAQFQEVLAHEPANADACNILAGALLQKGDIDAAIASWRKALQIRPDFAVAHNNLGNALLQKGQLPEAVAQFNAAIELDTNYATAHYDLGNALLRMGQTQEALKQYQKASELEPNSAEMQNNLGNALLQVGHLNDAMAHWEKALALDPNNPMICNNLAWVMATCARPEVRDGARAVKLAQRADQLSNGQNPMFLGTLAAAYAEAGQMAEAVAAAQRALQLADARSNAPLATALRLQLDLHLAGKPFRDQNPANAATR